MFQAINYCIKFNLHKICIKKTVLPTAAEKADYNQQIIDVIRYGFSWADPLQSIFIDFNKPFVLYQLSLLLLKSSTIIFI